MSEAEVIESAFIMGAGAISCFTVYLTVIFAYLAAAYLVGAELSRFQVAVLSGLFVAAEIITTAICCASVLGWEKLIEVHPSILTTIAFFTFGAWHVYMAIMLATGIFVGLYFMHDIRRHGAADARTSTR